MTNLIKFVCPKCKGELDGWNDRDKSKKNDIACKSCGKQYPFVKGVIDFRLLLDPDDSSWSVQEFEKMYENFGDWNSLYDWDRIRGIPQRATNYRYEKLKRKIVQLINPENEKFILDLGCGNGYFLLELRELFSSDIPNVKYIGFDVSLHNIINFRTKIQSRKINNVEAILCNAEHLPFESNSINLITCVEVLEHIADKKAALKEAYRILVPGGTLLFSTPSQKAIRNWNIILFPFRLGRRLTQLRLRRREGPAPFDEPVSKDKYLEILNEIGFRKVKLQSTQMLNDEVLRYMPKFFVNTYISLTGMLENNFSFIRKVFGIHIIGCVLK